MRRVVVTGLGAITPLGIGVRPTWKRLIAGESGVVSLSDLHPSSRWSELPSRVGGVVPSFRAGEWLTPSEERRMPLFAQYAVAASDMALADAGWRAREGSEREMTGVCVGSGIGNLEDLYDTSVEHASGGYRKVSPLFVPRLLINMAAGHVAMRHGLQGPNHSVTTACTTGAHSIGDASRFIALGDADVMLAGGAESCIHPLALAGFARAKSLSTSRNGSPQQSCRPFDAQRDGFVVAEGAAVCVLEELEHARARGARIYAEVAGYGCSCDAHHMTAPPEGGDGAYAAMRRALVRAGREPSRVGYVNAHATGTRIGDRAEALAIRRLMMGEGGWEREGAVTVSSTKGAVGHLLGASGAVEAIFAILAIHEGIVPPTLNLERPDVGVDFNFVPGEAQRRRVDVALSNSFGFGGTNSSLVFTRLDK